MGDDSGEKRLQSINLLRAVIPRAMILFGLPLIVAARFGPVIDVATGSSRTTVDDLFFHVFLRFEPVALVVNLAALAIVLIWLSRQRAKTDGEDQPSANRNRPWLVAGLAVGGFILTGIGTRLVFHCHRVVCEEYLTLWQAKIFLDGNLVANVPAEYRSFALPLKPWHSSYDEINGVWNSCTLPLYAAFYAPLEGMGLGAWFNPLLAALTVVVVACVARRLWPDEPSAPWFAALLLATSCQFLFNAMSFFAMPGYLLCNLAWLLVYLRDRNADRVVLPWIGVVALGLHQPFYHALFAIPFLLRLVRNRPWGWTVYTAAVYLAGCGGWLLWLRSFYHSDPSLRSPLSTGFSFLAFPSSSHLLLDFSSVVLLFSWQNLAVVIFGLAAFYRFRELPPPLRDLAYGLFLTFAFFMFFAGGPALTWGYRFCHAVLGNLVLLAVAGALAAQAACGRVLVRRLVVGSALLTLTVLVPLRAWQVESFVRPSVDAERWIASLPEDVVVLQGHENLLLGLDLVRNSPNLSNRPLRMHYAWLQPNQLEELKKRFTVRIVTAQELQAWGMLRGASDEPLKKIALSRPNERQ